MVAGLREAKAATLRKVPLARLWAIEGEDVVCEVQGGDGFERLRV